MTAFSDSLLDCRGRPGAQSASRPWLGQCYIPEHPGFNQQAVAGVKDVLSARAKSDGPERRLYNRVARLDGSIWYDLSDPRRAVRVSSEGWTVEAHPPVLFRRFTHQRPQVEPRHGGSIDAGLPFFNLADVGRKRLLATTVVSFFVPDIPHPIPALHGERGSARTTFCKFVRSWADPSETATLGEPNRDEIIQALTHNYVLPLDNLRRIEPWLSDVLCRAVTGEGFTKRMLYTDQDDIIFSFRRCVVLNGINSLPQRPDLLDRSILFPLAEIPEADRREDAEINAAFERTLPFILGATFTLLSKAMKLHDGFRLTTAPRMADFARWGAVISKAAGWGSKQFVVCYEQEASSRNEAAIEASPAAQSVRAFAEQQCGEWEGTASELLPELVRIAAAMGIDTRA